MTNTAAAMEKVFTYQDAQSLGFCEAGIAWFCEKLGLDLDKGYTYQEIKHLLDYAPDPVRDQIYVAYGSELAILETASKMGDRSWDECKQIIKDHMFFNSVIYCNDRYVESLDKHFVMH